MTPAAVMVYGDDDTPPNWRVHPQTVVRSIVRNNVPPSLYNHLVSARPTCFALDGALSAALTGPAV